MSMAGAECVSAPTETKFAPVAASSGIRSSVTPPEISTAARPRARGPRFADLLERHVVHEDGLDARSTASSTCASVSASISIAVPG